jgi:hypothetical protein
MVGARLLINQPAAGILEHLFQEFHEMIWLDLLGGFLSWILESVVLPPQVNLLLQSNDSVGYPVSSHADSRYTTLF